MGRGGRGPGGARFGFTVSRRMQVYETLTANNPRESAAMFDAEGNQIGNILQGDNESVDLTEFVNSGRLRDAVITHNHPPRAAVDENADSFSPADLAFAAQHDLRAIRAVRGNTVFTAERPAGGWPNSSSVHVAFLRRELTVVQGLRDRISSGEAASSILDDTKRIQRTLPHDNAVAVTNQFGIKYTRTTARGGRRR